MPMDQLTTEKIVSHLLYYLILYVVGLAAVIWFSYYAQSNSGQSFGIVLLVNVLYYLPVVILGAVVATFKHARLSLRTYRKILFISVLPIIFSWPVLMEWPGEAIYSPVIMLWFIGFVYIRLLVVTWDNR